jgi:glycerol-3-phosphate dehydrogenase
MPINNPQDVCILAGGAYGTALAVAIASRVHGRVNVWQVDEEQALEIERNRENEFFLPGVALPDNVHFTSVLAEAVKDSMFILSTVPTQPLGKFLVEHAGAFPERTPVISCSKGLNVESGLFPHEMWRSALKDSENPVGLLAGPSFAKELANGQLTAVTIYGNPEEMDIWAEIARVIGTNSFQVFISTDQLGAAVMGAGKNVLAILAGAMQGENARAFAIGRGLTNLGNLAKLMGSDSSAVLGMAGIGDVVLTCTSEESRNFSVGKLLGQGISLEEATRRVGLAEGVATTSALEKRLALAGNQKLPVFEAVKTLLQGGGVDEAIKALIKNDIFE